MSARRYVRQETSKHLPWQITMGLLLVSVLISLVSITIYMGANAIPLFQNYVSYIRTFALICMASTFAIFTLMVVEIYRQERTSMLVVDDMTSKAAKVAKRVKKLLSDKAVIDVLGFAKLTRYGYAMPTIRVYVADDLSAGYIAVENVSSFDVLDRQKMEQNVSGLLSGKSQRYSIVSSNLTRDDSYMLFHFEDVNTSHRLTVDMNDVSQFVSNDVHQIKLMDNLTLNFGTDTHHCAIVARTRSGKSVLASYMATLMKAQGWRVEYHSAKYDTTVKKFGGQSEPIKIVESAEKMVEEMNARLRKINEADKEKYLEVSNMVDIGLFFDELGSLSAALDDDKKVKARWNKAINRLTATGASAGIHVIAISQLATLEGLGLPNLARTNVGDSVIMLAEAANSPDERRYMMSGFADMPKRSYKVGQGLARFVGIGGMWSTPHLFEAPLIIDKSKELKKIPY